MVGNAGILIGVEHEWVGSSIRGSNKEIIAEPECQVAVWSNNQDTGAGRLGC